MNPPPRCKEEYVLAVKAIVLSRQILLNRDHEVNGKLANDFRGKPANRLDIT